jgi:hypothetical protein
MTAWVQMGITNAVILIGGLVAYFKGVESLRAQIVSTKESLSGQINTLTIQVTRLEERTAAGLARGRRAPRAHRQASRRHRAASHEGRSAPRSGGRVRLRLDADVGVMIGGDSGGEPARLRPPVDGVTRTWFHRSLWPTTKRKKLAFIGQVRAIEAENRTEPAKLGYRERS